MHHTRIFVILLILSAISTSNSSAQAWLQKKKASYSQVAFTSIVGTSKYSNGNEALDLSRQVSDRTVQLYHEYGLSDKLTLVANVPIKLVSTGDEIVSTGFSGNTLPSGNLAALGNVSLSAIYGLKQSGKWVYSAQVRTDLNTARQEESIGLRTGADAWGIAPSIHIGHSANSFWTSFGAGATLRSNDYSTQWFSTFKIGTKSGESTHVIAEFGALQSLEDGDAADGNATETGLYTNNIEYLAYSLKFGYELKSNFTIWGSIGGGISSNDVTRAPAYTLSVSYRVRKE